MSLKQVESLVKLFLAVLVIHIIMVMLVVLQTQVDLLVEVIIQLSVIVQMKVMLGLLDGVHQHSVDMELAQL